MDDQTQRSRERVAAAERDEKRTIVTAGFVVLWLATLLMVAGTLAVRGLF
jgi:hypothetical protein